jgi:hypothetical protein
MKQKIEATASKLNSKIELGNDLRPVWIIDEVIERDALEELYSYFKVLPFKLDDSDRKDTAYIKHLVYTFEKMTWKSNPVLTKLHEIIVEAAKERGIQIKSLKKVYANLNLYGDIQFAHQDGDLWTALFFLNSKWDEDWLGELFLYDSKLDGISVAVRPKPGRLILFDGLIKHRGGVPSKLCFEPRITLAMKFSR